jgi:hypothetical protein
MSKKRWSYSEGKRVLRIAVRAKRAQIVARARC